jgi:hypothetical protein
MVDSFASRAALYENWDARLRERTRFFAAAALINAALVEWCSHPLIPESAFTAAMGFLAGLGTHLQVLNVATAERIESGHWGADESDITLITLEQTSAEKLLQQLALTDQHGHGRVIRQLDRLLYCLGRAWRVALSSCGPSIVLLGHAVRTAQIARKAPISFVSMSDRIDIGKALVRLLRRPGSLSTELGAFQAGRATGIDNLRNEHE